jgi:hypothetical protein
MTFKQERDRQLEMSSLLEGVRNSEKRKVKDLHVQYSTWIRDTLETQDNASILVTAIFRACPKTAFFFSHPLVFR